MKNHILNYTSFLILFCLLIGCTDQTECIVILINMREMVIFISSGIDQMV